MCVEGFVPPVYRHFQWGLQVLKMEQESKASEVAVVGCLFHMVAVWILVVENIQDIEQTTKEESWIVEAVDQLIDLMDGHIPDILISCLQNLPERKNAIVKCVIEIDIPLHKACAVPGQRLLHSL